MIQSLAGLAPFQIAFVVADLEAAARRFDALLQAGPWRCYQFDEPDWSLLLALNDRHPQYELVQPISGTSAHEQWLRERGEGFHHMAYVVESIDTTAAELHEAGHPDGRGVYVDTVAALGCYVELVEPPARMPAPRFTL